MKRIIAIVVVLIVAVMLFIAHHMHAAATGPLEHARTSFDITVHAPYKMAAPLFGPEGERAWGGKDWNPQFIYPSSPADIQGAVFTVDHGHHRSTWIATVLDLQTGHIQYVNVIDGLLVTSIDIHISAIDASTTKANFVYEKTALSPDANVHIRDLAGAGPKMAREFEA